jgi:hypothetical protein
MKNRWLAVTSVVLVVFTYFVVVTQFYEDNPGKYGVYSIASLGLKTQSLAQMTNIVEFDEVRNLSRQLGLGLPKDARVFVNDMLGPTNRSKILWYGYLTYYLFPREIAVSVEQPAKYTKDGFVGRPPRSAQELLANGFDVVVETTPQPDHIPVRLLHALANKAPANPDWFRSRSDVVIAFLLPLLTALAGLCLVQFVFPTLCQRLAPLEKLACGLGLGMMAVAALTLGVKLCGFHGHSLVFIIVSVAAIWAVWSNYREIWAGTKSAFWQTIQSPVVMVGVLAFFLLFRMAGLWGLIESDAITAWMLKAKILHLYTGSDIIRWFSEPRLAEAHLDYPTLVPSLHAATFDSVGHVNECVTKFWPAWMLLLLVGALASLKRGGKDLIQAASFFLLALVLLPTTRLYACGEGATMPMIFFVVLGFLQCALWQVEGDRARLGLGLTLLFGAAMAKFEGSIVLVAAGVWTLLLPSTRPSLKASPRFWRVLAFWFAVALPFLCLWAQIPALHFESGWAGYALRHPGDTLSHLPGILMIVLSRWFVSDDLAAWNGEGGHLHWVGRWEGFASLYNHPTLGLAWISLLMTVALWFVAPARRKLILWMLAVILTTIVALSVVFASFVGVTGLSQALEYTEEITAARYLFPLLVAWSATTLILLFAEPSQRTPNPGADATAAPCP